MKIRKFSLFRMFTSAIIGGLIEAISLFPLDTIKSRVQNSKSHQIFPILKDLVQKEGFTSLYKGFCPFAAQLGIKYFIRLSSFDLGNRHLANHKISPGYRIFFSGIFAGFVET